LKQCPQVGARWALTQRRGRKGQQDSCLESRVTSRQRFCSVQFQCNKKWGQARAPPPFGFAPGRVADISGQKRYVLRNPPAADISTPRPSSIDENGRRLLVAAGPLLRWYVSRGRPLLDSPFPLPSSSLLSSIPWLLNPRPVLDPQTCAAVQQNDISKMNALLAKKGKSRANLNAKDKVSTKTRHGMEIESGSRPPSQTHDTVGGISRLQQVPGAPIAREVLLYVAFSTRSCAAAPNAACPRRTRFPATSNLTIHSRWTPPSPSTPFPLKLCSTGTRPSTSRLRRGSLASSRPSSRSVRT
jgi:hypothetical protein